MSNKKFQDLEKYIDKKININTFNSNINNIITSRNDLINENIHIHKEDNTNQHNINKNKVNNHAKYDLKNYNNILKIRENDFNKNNKKIITFTINIINKYFNKEYKLIQKNWFNKNNKTYIVLIPNTIHNRFNGWNNMGFFNQNFINNIDKNINKEFELSLLNILEININTFIKNKIINTCNFNKCMIYEENPVIDERYIDFIKDFKNLTVRYLYLKIKNKENYIIFKINLDDNFIEIKEIIMNIDNNLINNINKFY